MFKINMLLLGIIFLVMMIPLASLYLSTILIHRIALLIFISSVLFSEILGRLFQTILFSHDSLLSFSEHNFYNTATADITFLVVPVIIYSNADTDKLSILTDNKAGIYLWTHLE